MTERTEREEIAQIIAYEFANGPERFVCTKAANRIFAEHIEPTPLRHCSRRFAKVV
jgi:hypothetical protein